MKPNLSDIETLARQAGEILRAGFGQDYHTYSKGTIDLVTDIDRRSEEFLVGEIRRRFPDNAILAEESGSSPGRGNGL
jgi:myo-inositol-1(or 4)-monophosphatase